MSSSRRALTGGFALDLPWRRLALPGFAVLVAGFVAPLTLLAVYSLMRDGANGALLPPFGIGNYAAIVGDGLYVRVLGETLLLGLVVTAICASLSYPLAYFLARTRSRWRAVLIIVLITPLMISSVIRNIGWIPILGERGAVNTLLVSLHLLDRPLVLMNNLTGVVIALVHALLPFMTLMLMSVIQRIGFDLEEAAGNLGASRWQVITTVLLPMSLRGLASSCILVFAIAVSSYTTPAVLGGGRVLVMATFIAQQIQAVLRYAFGSALTIVLFAVVAGLSLLAMRWSEQRAG